MPDTTQFNREFAPAQIGDRAPDRSVQQDFARIGSDLVDALGERAEAIVAEQKTRAATEIAGLAAMVRNAAQCIDQGNRGTISDYATEMAGEIDRFADRLRVSSWRVLAADVEGFARRRPALFMASSAVAGFILGRVLMPPPDAPPAASGLSPRAAEPTSRPEDGAIGGTLSAGGRASDYGLPTAEETP